AAGRGHGEARQGGEAPRSGGGEAAPAPSRERQREPLERDAGKGWGGNGRNGRRRERWGPRRVPQEESFTDLTKTELLSLKANRTKIRYANTYRLEPYNKFQDYVVRKKAQEILTNKLQETKYDGVSSPSLCASISEEILTAIKELGYDRYKYVVSVLIVEKAGQAINVASRWVWDVQRDTWVSAKCETETFIALALIMACYYE
uniref:TC1D3 protein n=3 Tax=Nothoprocta TaxID=8806 RepID=A0A8C6Z6X3_NOTPE